MILWLYHTVITVLQFLYPQHKVVRTTQVVTQPGCLLDVDLLRFEQRNVAHQFGMAPQHIGYGKFERARPDEPCRAVCRLRCVSRCTCAWDSGMIALAAAVQMEHLHWHCLRTVRLTSYYYGGRNRGLTSRFQIRRLAATPETRVAAGVMTLSLCYQSEEDRAAGPTGLRQRSLK